ncbi:MAG: type II secretion system protein [Planctomycetia bacterium]|nr:type II secretion system protein [Planctomycetia bacterium]
MKARINKTLKRSGFTLVELLMVIVIIAMLGTMSITVSRMAVESAKRSRTEVTIAKLDSIITSMYEKYQYRKVDVSGYLNPDANPWNYPIKEVNKIRGRWRIHLLRDIIRMDMPCCLAEVSDPVRPKYDDVNVLQRDTARATTPLCLLYKRAMVLGGYLNADFTIRTNGTPRNDILNAELLYLIVSNGDPNARSMFSDREIGDTNGNGLFEFLDGWGTPIHWARWAPKFGVRENEFVFGATDRQGVGADPLDPLSLENGIMLVPVIYSYGPDRESGYNLGIYDEGNLASASNYLPILQRTLHPFDPGVDLSNPGNNTCANLVPDAANPTVISPLSLDNIHNQSVVK